MTAEHGLTEWKRGLVCCLLMVVTDRPINSLFVICQLVQGFQRPQLYTNISIIFLHACVYHECGCDDQTKCILEIFVWPRFYNNPLRNADKSKIAPLVVRWSWVISCSAALLKMICLFIFCSFKSPFTCLIWSVVLLNIKYSTGYLFKVFLPYTE